MWIIDRRYQRSIIHFFVTYEKLQTCLHLVTPYTLFVRKTHTFIMNVNFSTQNDYFPRRNRRNNGNFWVFLLNSFLYFSSFYFMNIGGTRQSQNKFCFALVCTMFLREICIFWTLVRRDNFATLRDKFHRVQRYIPQRAEINLTSKENVISMPWD